VIPRLSASAWTKAQTSFQNLIGPNLGNGQVDDPGEQGRRHEQDEPL